MGASASASPLVTISLELGFTTRMRRRGREAMLASSSICGHSWSRRGPSSSAKRDQASKEYAQMPQAQFDCVIRAGRVATAVDEFDADVGIKNGVIAAIGRDLPAGASEIDAKGRLVLPG